MIHLAVPESKGENKIIWRLEEWLEERRSNRKQLAEIMDGQVESNLTTLYRMSDQKRIDETTLTKIIEGCEKLTGERPDVGDLLEYQDA